MKARIPALILCTVLWAASAVAQGNQWARVMLPISSEDTHGSLGSLWTTELWFRNDSPTPTPIFPLRVSDQVPTQGVTVPLEVFQPVAGAPPGQFIYIDRAAEPDVRFQIRVRDISKQAGSFGVEIPAVHENEFVDHAMSLIQIPTASRFRTLLRVYEGAAGGTGHVHIKLVDERTERVLAMTDAALPTNGPAEYLPGYAQVGPLALLFPEISAAQRVRVELTPSAGSKIWAFVSITDNDTQEVTTVTPR